MVSQVTDISFEDEVISSQTPVLIDFWAEWCAPCRAIASIIEEVANEYAGRLKVVKIDVDSSPKVAEKFGIRGVPTLMIFKGGLLEATRVGALSKSQLTAFIDGNL